MDFATDSGMMYERIRRGSREDFTHADDFGREFDDRRFDAPHDGLEPPRIDFDGTADWIYSTIWI